MSSESAPPPYTAFESGGGGGSGTSASKGDPARLVSMGATASFASWIVEEGKMCDVKFFFILSPALAPHGHFLETLTVQSFCDQSATNLRPIYDQFATNSLPLPRPHDFLKKNFFPSLPPALSSNNYNKLLLLLLKLRTLDGAQNLRD